jgi:hypothetical protein
MHTLDEVTAAVRRQCAATDGGPAVLVGMSGVDGAGKGYLAGRLHARLAQAGLRVAMLNVDGWLNLPALRFSPVRQGEHFYHHALRLDAMFAELVLPLRRRRGIRLVAPYAEETATAIAIISTSTGCRCRAGRRIFIFKRRTDPTSTWRSGSTVLSRPP